MDKRKKGINTKKVTAKVHMYGICLFLINPYSPDSWMAFENVYCQNKKLTV